MPAKPQTKDPVQPRRPRGRPKTEDLAALEARLILVGRQLFYRHGYGATAMSAVAEAARVSKTTLYARFPSKAALFRAMVAEQIKAWDSGVNHTPMPDFDTLEEALLCYGDTVLRAGTTADFVQLNRLLYSESGRFPELAEIADARFRLGVDYLSGLIRAFAEREGVSCGDPEGAAELFLMITQGWFGMAVVRDRVIEPQARAAWLKKMVAAFLGGRPTW